MTASTDTAVSAFNAKAARAKRPCPLWVDAFLRDTTHLEADEIGAYLLLLMAMWIRESCDLPDDDARLARVARVSTRLWKSRVGTVIRPLLSTGDGVVFSKRLREEATYVERQVKQQSDRKPREKSDKPLKDNEPVPSADMPTDEPRDHPSYNLQPTEEEKKEDVVVVVGAGEAKPLFRRVLEAVGLNPNGILPARWMPPAAEIEVNRFRDFGNGLTDDQIVAVAVESRKRHPDPPKGPKALETAMRHIAETLAAPPPAAQARPQPPPRRVIDVAASIQAEARRLEAAQGDPAE